MTKFCAHRPMYTSKRLLRVCSFNAKSSRVSSFSREYQPGLDFDLEEEEEEDDLREDVVDGERGQDEGVVEEEEEEEEEDGDERMDISENDRVKEKRGWNVIVPLAPPAEFEVL
ncbi:hypothetical protein Slin15195_G107170 [Septoria linicola]|uniref:Uncharacterized protein n=1 Tax=Septoria linicola TaxID=215465 RepID=A0A9Q9B1W6_9PEZI|nr:hypothetical protein Slin15195_G107170 [Septoria linicola]